MMPDGHCGQHGQRDSGWPGTPRCQSGRRVSLLAALLLLAASPLPAAEDLAVVWSPFAGYKGRQVYLGPTGARGWVDGHRIHVAHIAKGSPAAGVLRVGDVLLGANGPAFEQGADPRVALGNAITDSETPQRGGGLKLTVERGGRQTEVTVRLRVMPPYGANWPHDCPKSARILEEACAHLARAQYPDGHFPGELGMATAWNGLLFLAAGDAKYLDNARRAACWLTGQDYDGVGLNAWPSGYKGMFLAEYYLATGDRTVLPKIEQVARRIAGGQMACGSWGHSIPWGGYGAVNQVGLTCWIAMILAKECGVPVDDAAIRRASRFFLNYAGKGSIPYGDHLPWLGSSGNGKDALAAVGFDVLGKEPKALRYFARVVAAAWPYREYGHTGSFFSFYWGPIAAANAGEDRFRKFLDEQRWYYDLCRTHDGGLTNQPNAENLSGRTPGTYTWSGPEYTTGGMALFYALPRKTLRVLGAPRSVFGATLSDPLAEARRLYEQQAPDELEAHLAKLAKAPKRSAEDGRFADQLSAAARRRHDSVGRTLARFESVLGEGDVYRASELLKSLERLLGKDHAQLAGAQKQMAANEQWVETGREYYKVFSNLREMAEQYWHQYGQQAAAATEEVVLPVPRQWEVLVRHEASPWRASFPDLVEGDPPALRKVDFDDSKWQQVQAPIKTGSGKGPGWHGPHVLLRTAFTLKEAGHRGVRIRLSAPRDSVAEVYLNGTKVLQAVRGPSRGATAIELPGAAGLLRKGPNLLSVHCRREDSARGELAVGLEATTE